MYEALDKVDIEAKKKKIEMEKMAVWKADQAKRQATFTKELPPLPAKDVVPITPSTEKENQ